MYICMYDFHKSTFRTTILNSRKLLLVAMEAAYLSTTFEYAPYLEPYNVKRFYAANVVTLYDSLISYIRDNIQARNTVT